MEKFKLLYSVLASLHKAGVLSNCVLICVWRKKVDEALKNAGLELPL